MAIFRNIQMSFWTDTKICDDFTPDDKLMYLYLMTNPHTNLCGCYEISMRQIVNETGMTEAAVTKALSRLEKKHGVIVRSDGTKEVLLPNWHRYNWTASDKFRKPLLAQIQGVKNDDFRDYLTGLYNGVDTVSVPYQYGMDTTVTVTDTVTDTVNTVFEQVWSMYPEKKGKGKVSDKDKRKLAEIGVDHLARAINRYKAEIKASSFKHYQNGSTFFHSGYLDYLDENYTPTTEGKIRSAGINGRDYNMKDLELTLINSN